MKDELIDELEYILYHSYKIGSCRIDENGNEDMVRVIEIYQSDFVELLSKIKRYHESKGELK